MLIIGLNGSPHDDGNTDQLLKVIIAEAASLGAKTAMIPVAQVMSVQKEPFCVVCSNPCSGRCYKNTDLEKAFETIKTADALIMGSPVYFGAVSGQLKAFWDKSRKLRYEKSLLNMVGSALSCGGARFGGQETTLKNMYDMMVIHGMILVGDGYKDDDCGHHGICAQQPSLEDVNAVSRARILAKRLVEVAEATRSLRTGRG